MTVIRQDFAGPYRAAEDAETVALLSPGDVYEPILSGLIAIFGYKAKAYPVFIVFFNL